MVAVNKLYSTHIACTVAPCLHRVVMQENRKKSAAPSDLLTRDNYQVHWRGSGNSSGSSA